MYHGRFKGSHYEAGYKYGTLLKKHGNIISGSPTFEITDKLKEFAKSSLPVYQEYYPEIADEIKGMADGQDCPIENIINLLFPMYCFKPENHCTTFAVADGEHVFLGNLSFLALCIINSFLNSIEAA